MSTPSAALHAIGLSDVCWRKSSYSGGANDCVEVAQVAGTESAGIAIRDSKLPRGGVLLVARSSFVVFVKGIRHR